MVVGIFCTSTAVQAQANGGPITTQDLSEVSSINGTRVGFPWSGCHEFEVEVGVGPFQVTTTVVICCVEGLCYPVFGQNINKSVDNGKAVISKSSSIYYGGYNISILSGTYSVNNKKEISNLVYKLVPSK